MSNQTNQMQNSSLLLDFQDSFETFHRQVMSALHAKYPDFPSETLDWVAEMTRYCVPGGKLNRGRMVVEAVKLYLEEQQRVDFERSGVDCRVESGEATVAEVEATEGATATKAALPTTATSATKTTLPIENLLVKANCLGWCIEWLQAYFLVADDIMDGSLLRRGQPCRHRQPGVGLIAINDALLLRTSIDLLLEGHFSGPQLAALRALFVEVERDTQMGQLLDLTMDWRKGPAISLYTQMVHYKTAVYSFYLPFACAATVLFGSHSDSSSSSDLLTRGKAIALQLGALFQIQDDVLDVFGDPRVTGKLGTDIQDGKCTWLLCRLLEKPIGHADRLLLQQSYATASGVEQVEALYRKYGLLEDFHSLEARMTETIKASIAELPSMWSQRVFSAFLQRIIKRIK